MNFTITYPPLAFLGQGHTADLGHGQEVVENTEMRETIGTREVEVLRLIKTEYNTWTII